jgi:hypothetical protein
VLIACWLYVVTLSTLAQSTCRPNGPASTKCLAFPPNSRAFEPRLFELKSLFPGNGISWTEIKAPKQARKFEDAFAETGPRKEAGQFGASAENREISVSVGVRGGAERTRTACQARSRYRTGLSRVIPPRQFCDQMSLSDNIIQKGLACGRHWSGTVR